ncbi:hypothetical protein [Levilactobacillus suantsaii]|uniref:hypothetical protein n=1 Tax=Levilactobacillus suantsaii TaxID=2292255 RepID=UPI0014833B96|nr:hypothetical protein [Levilactobacillus suantsaii]
MAKSIDEVMSWTLDQRILMGNLAQRIIDERTQQQSMAVQMGATEFWNALQKANSR